MPLEPPARADTPRKKWRFWERVILKQINRYNHRIGTLGQDPATVHADMWPRMRRAQRKRNTVRDIAIANKIAGMGWTFPENDEDLLDYINTQKPGGRASSQWDPDIDIDAIEPL